MFPSFNVHADPVETVARTAATIVGSVRTRVCSDTILTTPALGEGDLRDEGGGDDHDGGDCKAFEICM